MNIEIRQVSELEQKEWHFYLFERGNEFEIRFDKYYFSTRPTKRHKFQIARQWSRGEHGYWNINTIEQPAVPPDVEAEVKSQLKAMIDKLQIQEGE